MGSSTVAPPGETESGRLSPGLRLLAAAMRRMPIEIRRVGMLWEALYRSIGGGGFDDDPAIDDRWPRGMQPPIRGTEHRQLMLLDLRAWPERREYFSGRYFQRDICRLLEAMLREGDQYLDIGANIGMTTLLAGHLIGDTGRGLSFEPNPAVYSRLARHIHMNHLTRITPHPVAIAREESVSRLVLTGSNTGLGSLAPSPGLEGESFEVKTVPGDVFADQLDASKSTFLKIDVEGYEVNVLHGLSGILSWPEVAVVAEISDEMLRNAGHSRDELHQIMDSHGFAPFEFQLIQSRWGQELAIHRLDGPRDTSKYDALFAKPGSAFHARRIAPLLVGS
jgi:FkbM family methyltransferase